jgi:AraC-like DNA-binding protein
MTEIFDRLASLLERFRVRAKLFHSGALCGRTPIGQEPGRAFLHVIKQGRVEINYRDQQTRKAKLIKHQVDEPSLVFFPHAIAHDLHTSMLGDSDFDCASLYFDGGDQHPLVRALPKLIVLPMAAVSGLDQSLQLLFQETQIARCGREQIADRLFEVVLLQMVRWILDHPVEAGIDAGLLVGLSDRKLSRALTAIHDAPGEAWSLPRLAQIAGMSRSAFAAAFKTAMAQTPGDYLSAWRMQLAQQQLQQGRAVKSIAITLGFADSASLSKAFAQRFGSSPRAWLQSQMQ